MFSLTAGVTRDLKLGAGVAIWQGALLGACIRVRVPAIMRVRGLLRS